MIISLAILGCSSKKQADLIVYNARVYTVDSLFSLAGGFAVKDGLVIAVGEAEDLLREFDAPVKLDAGGKFIYPGFIDAHCHFYHYGLSLQRADLSGTSFFEEVLDALLHFRSLHKTEWLTGRGWDQNDWTVKEFPDNARLDELFPDVPVLIMRIDGHAALANSLALQKAGITGQTKVPGGTVHTKNGKPSGILIDNAISLVSQRIPKPDRTQQNQALTEAESKCFAAGITTVADAGLSKDVVLLMDELHQSGKLRMQVYAMLDPTEDNFEHFMVSGIYQTGRLHVRSVKLYADGALGSRGACLLEPYSDEPGNSGLLVETQAALTEICKKAYSCGYQVNIHAIGDSGVRTSLHIFADILQGANDLRWRIEHAQCVAPGDFQLFGRYHIVPSVQPVHATSDMGWAKDRLGSERVKNAYAYRQLLGENGWIALGTDFPIEKIDPLLTFYAAVFRCDADGNPEGGWQAENALTREQALRGMTIWAAHSCFEEKRKGSIEPGKNADFVMLDTDIMTADRKSVLQARNLRTYVQGKLVYVAK